MVATGVAQLDRQLGVEVLLDLAERRERLFLEARSEAGLRDIDEQARHLRLARQLPQHRAEVALDLGKLRAKGVEIRGLALPVLELRAQIALVRLGAL